jgi:DNA-binding CsgD family transcriptional regulator
LPPGPLTRSEAVARIIRRSITRLEASRDAEELAQMIPVPLVELGHFDRVLYWRTTGHELVPVAAAFADSLHPSRYVLHHAFANPVPLESCDAEATVLHDGHQASVSRLRPGGPLSPLLGAMSYAVAVVTRGADAVGLLQAAHQALGADSLDRELLWAFAEICSTVMQQHTVTRQLNHQNGLIRALLCSVTGADDGPPAHEPARTDGLTLGGNAADQKAAEILAPLTPREREVFQLLLKGAPNLEIARELVIADATVKSHVQSILHKFGVTNRSQAIATYNAATGSKVTPQATAPPWSLKPSVAARPAHGHSI